MTLAHGVQTLATMNTSTINSSASMLPANSHSSGAGKVRAPLGGPMSPCTGRSKYSASRSGSCSPPSGPSTLPRLSADQSELVGKHLDLADKVASKMFGRLSCHMSRDDARAVARVALCEAALRFDPKRGSKFSSFAYAIIRGALLDEFTAQFPGKRTGWRHWRAGHSDWRVPEFCHYDDERMTDGYQCPGEQLQDLRNLRALPIAIRSLRRQHREMITSCYLEGQTMKEAGRSLGISPSRASRVHARALRELRWRFERGAVVELMVGDLVSESPAQRQ